MLATSSSSGIQAALSFHSASSSHDLFGCCVAKKQCFRAKAQTVTRRQHPFSRATVRGDASQRSQNASRRHRRQFSYSCKYGDNNHQPQCGDAVLKRGAYAPWWPALRPAAVPEDRQATGIRSTACADWVGWDWCCRDGGMRECTRNAHHGLPSARIPNLNEDILQNQATSRNVPRGSHQAP